MPNITKHDTDEKAKSDNVERCWIDFCIRRDAVGIDNLLRDF